MDNEKYTKKKEMLAKQEDILAKEEIYQSQKSRETWLIEEDHNTKFFHNSTIFNRYINKTIKVKDPAGTQVKNSTGKAKNIYRLF